MPNSVFSEQLARMASRGFDLGVSGIAEAAKASLMTREEAKIGELLSNLQREKALIGGDPTSTGTQLKDVNNEASSELDRISEQATLMMEENNKVLQSRKKLSDIYSKTVEQLSTMTTPEAQKIAKTLGVEFSQQDKLMAQRAESFMNNIKYSNELFRQAVLENNVELTDMQVEKAKQDTDALNLFHEMLSKTNILEDITLAFDQNSGELSYDPDKIYDKVHNLYGNRESFSDSYLLLKNYIEDNTRNFRTPPKRITTKRGKAADDELAILNKFNMLKQWTKNIDHYQFDDSTQWIRDYYTENLSDKDLKIVESRPELMFSNLKAIDEMGSGAAKKIAMSVYDRFFNSSSENSYWQLLDDWQDLVKEKSFSLGDKVKLNSVIQPGYTHEFYADQLRIGTPEWYESNKKPAGFSSPGYYQLPYSQTEHQYIKKELLKKAKEQVKSKNTSLYLLPGILGGGGR